MIKQLIFTSNVWSISGSQKITPHDYEGMGAYALNTNPPMCGIPYSSINIRKITAIEGMKKEDCYKCIKISNAEHLSKYDYVLAVDLGGKGLDLNMASFKKLFNQTTDPSWASWNDVDPKFCNGIVFENKDWYKNNSTFMYIDDQTNYDTSDDESDEPLTLAYNTTNNSTNNSRDYNVDGKWVSNYSSKLDLNMFMLIFTLFI